MYARAFVVMRRAAFVVGYFALYLVVYIRVYVLARCRWRYIQIISKSVKDTVCPVLFNKVGNCGFLFTPETVKLKSYARPPAFSAFGSCTIYRLAPSVLNRVYVPSKSQTPKVFVMPFIVCGSQSENGKPWYLQAARNFICTCIL